MKNYCFGIDIGGTSVKCGLFDVQGEVLEKWEIKTRVEDNGAYILPDIAASINHKISEKQLNRAEIAGVGIGVPGPVDEAGVVLRAVNLHWGRVQLQDRMEHMVDLPVRAGNDANVAALGEMWKGGGTGYHNVVMVTLGTGVGGGVIINGQVVAGTHGAGGEIGHIHVGEDIPGICNCGKKGCLEQVASATGIVRLANQYLSASEKPSLLRERKISAKVVFDAVKAGDDLAVEIAECFGKYLGKALSVIAGVVDPEAFVIGGGVSKAGPVLLEFIQKYYREYAFSACKEAVFTLAELGNDAGIYGAAKLVLFTDEK